MDKPKTSKLTKSSGSSDVRDCFYCHETGHLIAVCPALKKKNKFRPAKSVCLVRTIGIESYEIDSAFEPFTGQGMILISGLEEDQVPVTWLLDTGTAQSFILESALPFSRDTYCGSDVLVQGIEMGVVKVPLHTFYICSDNWFRKSGGANTVTCDRRYNEHWERFSRGKSTSYS